MSTSKAKRASYVTRAFGHYMDVGGPTAGTWIISVLTLESCPSIEEIKEVISDRLLTMSRFKSVLIVNKSTAYFEEIEHIEWKYHLVPLFNDSTPSEDELLKFFENIFEFGLDTSKPLWRCMLVPELDDGTCSLITVFNHAIADGIASIGVLLKLVDDSPLDPTIAFNKQKVDPGKIVQKRRKGPELSAWTKAGMFFYGIGKGLTAPFDSADPSNSFRMEIDPNDKEKYNGKKKFGKSEMIPLQDIKDLKVKFKGATINDILLALMTITLRKFLEEVEDPILKNKTKNMIRGNFPVSMRGKDEALLKGNNPCNKWQPFAFRFPLDYENAVDCVWKVKDIVDKNKASPELPIQNTLGGVMMNTLPRSVVLPTFLKMSTKASMMLSNVPGPQEAVHLCDKKITNMNFYLVAPIGTYLGVLSYAGQVSLTVNFDDSLGIEPSNFLKHWTESIKELSAAVAELDDPLEE